MYLHVARRQPELLVRQHPVGVHVLPAHREDGRDGGGDDVREEEVDELQVNRVERRLLEDAEHDGPDGTETGVVFCQPVCGQRRRGKEGSAQPQEVSRHVREREASTTSGTLYRHVYA